MKVRMFWIVISLMMLNACSSSGRFAILPPTVLTESCVIERGDINTWRDLVVEYQNEKSAHELCASKFDILVRWINDADNGSD